MLSVSIIGGYLGAGKTTLVNHLLRHANGTKIAVLVNEFGALPIDADLIEAQDDALISIAGGCVCCSYGNDLIQAMLDLASLDMQPDHVLIESSGVALPGAIASSVGLIPDMHVEGIVVLCDAETIRDQASNDYVGDTVARQLADADMVVLNKTDLLEPARVDDVTDWLSTMAPEAAVIHAQQAKVPNALILQNFESKLAVTSPTPHVPAFETKVIPFDAAQDAEAIGERLASPDLGLIRAKGFVPTSGGLRAVQVVGRRWRVSPAPDGASPGVVVIAHPGNPKMAEIETLF